MRLIGQTAVFVALAISPLLAGEKPPADTNVWTSLFDGKSLRGWTRTDFSTLGDVWVEDPFRGGSGAIVVALAEELNGVNRTRPMPKTDYEVSLEAMRLAGHDFFCGLTFPVGDAAATFVVGGWSGSVVGLSCVDGADAAVNETTRHMDFDPARWYRIRVRVTAAKIECWIDEQKVVDLALAGRKISLRPGEIVRSLPFGLAAWHTSAAWREIKLRRLR
ncbi:MAG: DUF1080 domain-containing protein [Verrucomicrobia bacterium]|nr:DUF1080 domain-containing protein [Verrucomicrobiota bacterium]